MVSASQLQAIMPRCDAAVWAPALAAAMEEFAITTPERAAPFLANIAEESSELTHLVENLNYSADGLMKTWPSRFTAETAEGYAHQPEKIANCVYAGRNGNRDEASGDGWLYRGRSPIMLTGRLGYMAAGEALRVTLMQNPDFALQPDVGARIAAWFFAAYKKLNGLADQGDLRGIRRSINGGFLGMDQVAAYAKSAQKALAA